MISAVSRKTFNVSHSHTILNPPIIIPGIELKIVPEHTNLTVIDNRLVLGDSIWAVEWHIIKESRTFIVSGEEKHQMYWITIDPVLSKNQTEAKAYVFTSICPDHINTEGKVCSHYDLEYGYIHLDTNIEPKLKQTIMTDLDVRSMFQVVECLNRHDCYKEHIDYYKAEHAMELNKLNSMLSGLQRTIQLPEID